jgi:seryl-tRNA synthetase
MTTSIQPQVNLEHELAYHKKMHDQWKAEANRVRKEFEVMHKRKEAAIMSLNAKINALEASLNELVNVREAGNPYGGDAWRDGSDGRYRRARLVLGRK